LTFDLSQRATDPESLDVGVPEAEALASLGDLRFVNRWLGGRDRLRTTVQPYLLSSDRPRLLDVGCGSGDVSSFLARSMPRPVQAVGLDLKMLHVRQAPREVQPLVANARALPFRPEAFDVVLVSLFLHHFDAADLPGVLRGLYATCRRALVVTDLRRALVPYVFGRTLFRWLFRSQVSVEDGLLSIRRSFREQELRDAFVEAGIPHVRIRRVFPYRLLAVAERTRSY
jgi:ubiquinone/menaquinone biosynthesis C-methylase UbiE